MKFHDGKTPPPFTNSPNRQIGSESGAENVTNQNNNQSTISVPVWQPVVLAAMAGGMAWGIRGQYGHESGAMIAGLLVSLILAFLLCPNLTQLRLARAIAWATVAMGIGGSMTYGQTLGLAQNADMIGNWAALRWGMIGVVIKGGVWIAFCGLFLGMGLGGKRYRPLEILLVMLAALVAYYIGTTIFNSPYDPAARELPSIYFSADWYWSPDAGPELRPRHECWGGLLFALIAVTAYTGWWRKDRLARNMALWGLLGGALGFPAGESLQAYHAWNPEVFKQGIWLNLDPYMNWWNMMETTFGAVMGGALGFGLWLNRHNIPEEPEPESKPIPIQIEIILLAIHIPLLVAVDFLSLPDDHPYFYVSRIVDSVYDLGLMMVLIPIVAIAAGRWWPYLVILPITLITITGKTVRELVIREVTIQPALGWFVYLILPLLIATAVAVWFVRQADENRPARSFTRPTLLLCSWIYFLLNYAYFKFPWPWAEWTGRTPNGIIFTVFVICLTAAALLIDRQKTQVDTPALD